jgi:prepilin-type processing-associated H-X9-DG protein
MHALLDAHVNEIIAWISSRFFAEWNPPLVSGRVQCGASSPSHQASAMSVNPYDASKMPGQPPEPLPAKRGFRLIELFFVLGIIGLLITFLLPNVRSAREAGRRASCTNNLKQIGIALHNYADEYDALPPAYTVDADGKPLHSWRTLILPFMEQAALYEKIDLSKPWDDPANQAARNTRIRAYQCPSAVLPETHTTYLAVVGPGSCLQPGRPRPWAEITDDHSLTLVVMDVAEEHAVHWMSPTDASEPVVLSFASAKLLSHPGGTQGLFADGSVNFLQKSSKPAALRAMISVAGDDDQAAREVD